MMSEEELIVPDEFQDILLVLEMGAKKYGPNSWLSGNHFDVHKNHRSMSHHLLESYREMREDHESGLDPLLHLVTRGLMEYTLRKRGLIDVNTGKVDPRRVELSGRQDNKESIATLMTGLSQALEKYEHDWGFDIKRPAKHSEK